MTVSIKDYLARQLSDPVVENIIGFEKPGEKGLADHQMQGTFGIRH